MAEIGSLKAEIRESKQLSGLEPSSTESNTQLLSVVGRLEKDIRSISNLINEIENRLARVNVKRKQRPSPLISGLITQARFLIDTSARLAIDKEEYKYFGMIDVLKDQLTEKENRYNQMVEMYHGAQNESK